MFLFHRSLTRIFWLLVIFIIPLKYSFIAGILDSEAMDLQQDIKLNSTSGNQETIGDDVSNDKGDLDS